MDQITEYLACPRCPVTGMNRWPNPLRFADRGYNANAIECPLCEDGTVLVHESLVTTGDPMAVDAVLTDAGVDALMLFVIDDMREKSNQGLGELYAKTAHAIARGEF